MFTKLRDLKWRLTTFVGRWLCRSAGVELGAGVRFVGLPIVTAGRRGSIRNR